MPVSRDSYCRCLYYSATALARKITRMAEEEFEPTGLAPSLGFVIMTVNKKPGITAGEIARIMQLQPSTVTRLVDKLEDDGYLERLQKLSPDAHFVKSFSCIGNAFMVNPNFNGVKPTMFICSNHDGAKSEVKAILDQFGLEVEDMGKVEAARAIEPLAMLWCIPGFLSNSWMHAFKLLKK